MCFITGCNTLEKVMSDTMFEQVAGLSGVVLGQGADAHG